VTLTFARIVPAADAETLSRPVQTSEPLRARIVPEAVVLASDRAAEIVARAEARARAILGEAEAAAAALHERTRKEARDAALAELAAHALRLARNEAAADERATARLVDLARLLAERLLGEALRLEPGHVVALARNAIAEARGARLIRIVAHPDDAAELERALAEGGLERVSAVVASSERSRGSLRLDTEIGTLDADLAPQLDRLAAAVRASLSHEPGA
jgi:flagellar biosynthesis/type III secretory pathway protein FliH